ncbi:hypothetical protein OH76DRAFT_389085 [Lentinus brumalis]|uniref:Uncharacterized protein n=1 Tax=Lentinus brumalis TaxID=2498619 RepID=A0A371DVD6_9APHY|nr:hypothetical protein OH76DRAFT_389085 [Polyporus brumalis]
MTSCPTGVVHRTATHRTMAPVATDASQQSKVDVSEDSVQHGEHYGHPAKRRRVRGSDAPRQTTSTTMQCVGVRRKRKSLSLLPDMPLDILYEVRDLSCFDM